MAKINFSVYTYQLNPTTTIQRSIFDKDITYEEMVAKKNEIFENAIIGDQLKLKGHGYSPIVKIMYHNGEDILLKIGVEKNKERNTSEFGKEVYTDYPNSTVYINNNKQKQLMVVEDNVAAFADPKTLVRMIGNAIGEYLYKNGFHLSIEQKFSTKEFWETIEKYRDRIITLRFEFIKPNMSSISTKIKGVLNGIESVSNSHRTTLGLHALPGSTLENLNPENETISAIVDYQSEGGGPPPIIRVKSIKKNIKTVENEKTISIDEFEGSSEDLVNILRSLTSNE